MRGAESRRRATSTAGSRTAAVRQAGLLFIVVVALVACADPALSRPGESDSPVQPPPLGFPALSGTAEVYVAVDDGAIASPLSRYVLYDNGAFALQFAGRYDSLEYRGRYARAGSAITFDWEGWSAAGPWGARGTLSGDSLVVKYNDVMQMTDFVDATYVRVSGT